jgi:hypothetical protein
VLVAVHLRALNASAFNVHADAPALGFAALACALALRRHGVERVSGSVAIGLMSALALSAKQTMAPLALFVPWIAIVRSPRASRGSVLGIFVLCHLAVAGAWLTLFDREALLLNTFGLLRRHPWIVAPREAPGQGLGLLADDAGPLGVALLVAATILAGVEGWLRGREAVRGAMLPAWVWLFLIGASFLPLASLHRVKIGGDVNAGSPVFYFLVPALIGGVGSLSTSVRRPGGRLARDVLLHGAAVVLLTIHLPSLSRLGSGNPYASTSPAPIQQACRTLRSHPEQVYFPWLPLVHIAVEGKARPFVYAVFDRTIGAHRPTRDRVRALLPSRLRWIAYHAQPPIPHQQVGIAPEFNRQVAWPALPGWLVFTTRDGANLR